MQPSAARALLALATIALACSEAAVGPATGWVFINGEWEKDCVYYADTNGDGRIDYRRAAEPCGSFQHVVWFDRDGDGYFDPEPGTTDGERIPVPRLATDPAPTSD